MPPAGGSQDFLSHWGPPSPKSTASGLPCSHPELIQKHYIFFLWSGGQGKDLPHRPNRGTLKWEGNPDCLLPPLPIQNLHPPSGLNPSF